MAGEDYLRRRDVIDMLTSAPGLSFGDGWADGLRRLVERVRRMPAASPPLPETVREVLRAVDEWEPGRDGELNESERRLMNAWDAWLDDDHPGVAHVSTAGRPGLSDTPTGDAPAVPSWADEKYERLRHLAYRVCTERLGRDANKYDPIVSALRAEAEAPGLREDDPDPHCTVCHAPCAECVTEEDEDDTPTGGKHCGISSLDGGFCDVIIGGACQCVCWKGCDARRDTPTGDAEGGPVEDRGALDKAREIGRRRADQATAAQTADPTPERCPYCGDRPAAIADPDDHLARCRMQRVWQVYVANVDSDIHGDPSETILWAVDAVDAAAKHLTEKS